MRIFFIAYAVSLTIDHLIEIKENFYSILSRLCTHFWFLVTYVYISSVGNVYILNLAKCLSYNCKWFWHDDFSYKS